MQAARCPWHIATAVTRSTGSLLMSSSPEQRGSGQRLAARRAARDRPRVVGVLPLARLPRRRSRCRLARAAGAPTSALVLLAAVVIQLVYIAQAARWRLIAGTLELTVRRFYALVLGGLGANDVLPLRIGDLLRARWLATSAEIPTGRAFGSVFRDRACDVLTLVVALVLSLPFIGSAAWVARIAVGGVVLLAILVLVVVAAIAYVQKRPRARREQRGRGRRLLRDTIDELASPIGRRTILSRSALSVVAWGIWACTAGLVCRSLGITSRRSSSSSSPP